MTEKYVNIALIGHVSNGKTTLVKALTGVNTKRHSSEKNSGRTIQLGYANCLLWRCPLCTKVITTGQDQKKYSCCGKKIASPSHYISFADAPGHHNYVSNMIKGASIVDCAILVVDARKPSLQVQTLEHLAIIEILGVNNIIVAQNKVDLVSRDECQKHYNMLRTELRKTIAENAPIIPISAQNSFQIDRLQECIYRMLENITLKTGPNVFSVIRSFDINKPGCSINDLKGGVLGGTVLGKGFNVGDVLQIRPGNFPVQIRSIFSERKSLQHTVRGGLYGLGTNLDPTLTRKDNLVGALVGHPEDLPDIQTQLKMKIVHVNLGGYEKIKVKKNKEYKLIIGSNVVTCMCIFREKPYVIMNLSRPVCIIDTRCLIYDPKSTQLIAFGILQEKDEEIRSNIFQSIEEYMSMLPGNDKNKESKEIPIPVTIRENRNTIWSNMGMFCQVVHRQEIQVVSYLQRELCVTANVCHGGLRFFKMNLKPNRLQNLLRNYIITDVICDQCKGINTELQQKHIICRDCGSIRVKNSC